MYKLLELIYNQDFDDLCKRIAFSRPMPGFDKLLQKQRLLGVEFTDWCTMPVLKKEQEVYLFRQYNCLKFSYNLARNSRRPDRAEERLKNLFEVRDVLACCNVRLVVNFIKKKNVQPRMFLQKVSDGMDHLLLALEKYDYSRGNKFSTYLAWVLIRNFGRNSFFDQRMSFINYCDPEEIEIYPEDNEDDVDDVDIYHLFKKAGLNRREVKAILANEGIYHDFMSLEEIGRQLNISKEGVRQIKLSGVKKLRELFGAAV